MELIAFHNAKKEYKKLDKKWKYNDTQMINKIEMEKLIRVAKKYYKNVNYIGSTCDGE